MGEERWRQKIKKRRGGTHEEMRCKHEVPRGFEPRSLDSPRPSTPSVRCRTSTTTSHAQCLLPDLNHDQPRPVFAAGTSTTTIHAQCSLPDLNHDHPRPVFAAGPQPRPATPSVRRWTSTTTINAQCSLLDLNSYAKSYAR